MKGICISLFLIISTVSNAAQFTISISGFQFSPMTLNAVVGDTITINASPSHPTVQVNMATWNVNGTAPVAGGFPVQTAAFTFVIASPSNIYYVCQNHVASHGMKGVIMVTPNSVLEAGYSADINIVSNLINVGEGITVINNTGKTGFLEIYDLSGKLSGRMQFTSDKKQTVNILYREGTYLCRFIINGFGVKKEKLYILSN